MKKQQAQYIADYINQELDTAENASLDEENQTGVFVDDDYYIREVDSSMILDALDAWNDQQDKGG
jgi:hypothetical protein